MSDNVYYKMEIEIYQVDAFTDNIFGGNPAAVCPLDSWISEKLMQQIAMENNLSETAFFVKKGSEYEIRWFTPSKEVDLCGHATLAGAFVIFHFKDIELKKIHFYSSRSGKLSVEKADDILTLNFPVDISQKVEFLNEFTQCFDIQPIEALKGKRNYMLVYENETQIKNIKPDFDFISKLNSDGVIVTAKGDSVDFVSRYFCPKFGISEDPVTGSAHTSLTPYWAHRLNKKELTARQISKRQGNLKCTLLDDRVAISGKAKLYLSGKIFV